jgi:fatty-acyl-CoA synthase
VLHEHPAVAEAAVIGRFDPKWQEVPVAYVVRKAAVSADEITRHVGAQLARFKVPREVIFLDALPRNALGKVQHFVLRQEAARRS